MFSIIVLGVVAIIVVIAILGALFSDEGGPGAAIGVAVIGAVIFALVWTAFAVTTVGARQIGVVTSFGKVQDDTLTPGLHFKKPWESVEEIDGAKITMKYAQPPGDPSTDTNKGCFAVQIGDLSQACVAGVIQYRHKTDEADTLFSDYRGVDDRDDNIEGINEAIQDSLVRTQTKAAVGQVFRTFNPLIVKTDADGKEQQVAGSAPDLDTLSQQVEDALTPRLDDVELVNFTVTELYFSKETQSNIKRLQEQAAATRAAVELKKTNEALSEANKELAGSVSKDPNVLVANCYELVARAMDKGYALPDNFQCWPGTAGGTLLGIGGNK